MVFVFQSILIDLFSFNELHINGLHILFIGRTVDHRNNGSTSSGHDVASRIDRLSEAEKFCLENESHNNIITEDINTGKHYI